MGAFGDSLLFLGVFCLAAIPATCAMLFFLRPYHRFWQVFSAVALIFAVTVFAASVEVIDRSPLSAVVFIRILVAPLFALNFLLCGIFAPNRVSRLALLAAGGLEAAGFAAWVIACLIRNHYH
jgi:hypothetical protein